MHVKIRFCRGKVKQKTQISPILYTFLMGPIDNLKFHKCLMFVAHTALVFSRACLKTDLLGLCNKPLKSLNNIGFSILPPDSKDCAFGLL